MVKKLLICEYCNEDKLEKVRQIEGKSVVYRCKNCGTTKEVNDRRDFLTDKRVSRQDFD